MDHEKILKLLNLSKSPNDNEALLAIRTANAYLEKFGVDWWSYFKTTSCDESYAQARPEDNHEAIQEMLKIVLEQVQGDASNFIASLNLQFARRGSLSPKQYQALLKFYKNCRKF